MCNDNYSAILDWCERHDFPWTVVNNKFYYQTNIQTAELNLDKPTIKWHDHDYFEKITRKENTNVCNMPEKAIIEIRQSKETGNFYLNFVCWNNRGYDGLWRNSKEEIPPEVITVIYDFLEACADFPVEEEVDEEFCLTGK